MAEVIGSPTSGNTFQQRWHLLPCALSKMTATSVTSSKTNASLGARSVVILTAEVMQISSKETDSKIFFVSSLT
jgi:hypothetical protein